MNLHEYQAKQLFREYGIAVSEGLSASSSNEAEEMALSLNVDKWVVKAQVHAGGRGKAGGVEVVSSIEEVKEFAEKWLGNNLVTFQTDEKGQPVNEILIETCTNIDQELYLGAVIDRASQRLVVMASTEGGVNIEEVAEKTPEKIFKQEIDPINGPDDSQARSLSEELGLNAFSPNSSDRDLACESSGPLMGSISCLKIFSGVFSATSSMLTPPSVDAITTRR